MLLALALLFLLSVQLPFEAAVFVWGTADVSRRKSRDRTLAFIGGLTLFIFCATAFVGCGALNVLLASIVVMPLVAIVCYRFVIYPMLDQIRILDRVQEAVEQDRHNSTDNVVAAGRIPTRMDRRNPTVTAIPVVAASPNRKTTTLTDRDIPVLEDFGEYIMTIRRQVQRRRFPNDTNGRITRRRLATLHRDGYINKHRMCVVNPDDDSPSPVWHLAKKGCQFLAEHKADDRYLLKPVQISQPMHLYHSLAVTETHMLFDDAIARQSAVTLDVWHNEQEIVNTDEPDHTKHFRLFTELRKSPQLVCAPDAGFVLTYKGHAGVFFLEQDRNTSGHRQVAARKSPGYSELHRRRLHRRLYPQTTLDRFTVLLICPHAKRRDALRRSFREKDGVSLWRFAAESDLTPESLLHEPIWYRATDDDPQPLVKLSRETGDA